MSTSFLEVLMGEYCLKKHMHEILETMYKINVHNSILEFGQPVLECSPFMRTLFTTEHMVEKDVNGIIVFNKFSLMDMEVYIEYCMTGKLRCLSEDVMEYMMHKLPDLYYPDMDTEYVRALYEDQWHKDRNLLPEAMETSHTLDSIVSNILHKDGYVIESYHCSDKLHGVRPSSVQIASIKSDVKTVNYHELLMDDLRNALEGQDYAIYINDDRSDNLLRNTGIHGEIVIYVVGDGTGMFSKVRKQDWNIYSHEPIIEFRYGYSSISNVLYGLPSRFGIMLCMGKLYRTSKHKYLLDDMGGKIYVPDLLCNIKPFPYSRMRAVFPGLEEWLKDPKNERQSYLLNTLLIKHWGGNFELKNKNITYGTLYALSHHGFNVRGYKLPNTIYNSYNSLLDSIDFNGVKLRL
jgi:hypothetical protein